MPTLLRFLCIAFAVLVTLHACLSPFIEEGYWFVLPLVIDASFLRLLWAFYRRRESSISWLSIVCIVGVVMNLLFVPISGEYGQFTTLVAAQLFVEAAVLLALYFVLKMPSTKSWFYGTET